MGRGYKRGKNLTKDILQAVGKAGILAVASTSPYFLHALVKAYFRDQYRERAKRMRDLQRRKLINIRELKDGRAEVSLTHQGKQLVRTYGLNNLKLQKPARWDHKWRLLIYDIPTSQRRASNAFRSKIREMGLYQLQRSVWVAPYEFIAEVEFLAGVFEIDMNKCIHYFHTQEIPREEDLRKFFAL